MSPNFSGHLAHSVQRLGRFWPLYVVGAIGVIVTLVLYVLSERVVDSRLGFAAKQASDHVAVRFGETIKELETVLRSASMVLEREPDISKADWNGLARQLQLQSRFATLSSFGYAKIFAIGQDTKHLSVNRLQPEGHRETASRITLLFSPNPSQSEKLGADVLTDVAWRDAIEHARDAASVALIRQVPMMTGAERRPGILIAMPVYKHSSSRPATETERRNRISGVVFLAMFSGPLIAAITKMEQPIAVRVFDGVERLDSEAPYDSSRGDVVGREKRSQVRRFATTPIEIGGRIWSVNAIADSNALNAVERHQSTIVLIVGLLLTVKILALMHVVAGTRRGAAALARNLTGELAAQRQALLDQQAILEAMIANTPLGVFRTSGDGRIHYVNPRGAALLGIAGREHEVLNWTGLIHTEDQAAVIAQLGDIPSKAAAASLVCRLAGDAEPARWIHVSVASMGSGTDVVCTVEDISARKKAEHDAKHAREFLNTVLDLVPITVFVKDRNGVFRILNRPACEFLGIDYGSAIGKTDFDLFDPEQADRFSKEDQSVLARNKPLKIEDSFVTVRGSPRWVMKNKTKISMPDGEIFLVGSITDVTDHHALDLHLREAQAELRQAREFLASVLDSIPMPITVKDEAGRFVLLNRAAEKISMRSKAEVLGKTDFDFFSEDRSVSYRDEDQQTIAADHPIAFEGSYLTLTGESRWIIRNKSAVRVADGSKVVVTALTDITERKAAESESQRAQQFLENLLNALPNAIFVKDAEHRLILVNDAFAAMTGRTREELVGRADSDLFSSVTTKGHWIEDDAIFASKIPVTTEEIIVDADGRERWYLKSKSVITLAEGAEFVVGFRTDITDKKQADLKVEREREFLKNVIDALPSPLFVKDRQHRWIIVNTALANLFECDPRELIGRSDLDVRSEEEAARTFTEDEDCFTQPGVRFYEDTHIHPDGTISYRLKSKAAIELIGGDQYLVGFNADISRLKRLEIDLRKAETAARHAEEFMRLVLDSLPMPVVVKDERGVFVLVNRATVRLTGRPVNEVIGKTDYDLFPPEVAAQFKEEDRQASIASESIVLEGPYMAPAGASLWMIRVKNSVRLADGSQFLIAAMMDITERKQAETSVEKARAFLDGLINALPTPIFVKDRRHRWVMVNDAHASHLGVTRQQMIGHSDPEFYPTEAATTAWREDDQLFAGGPAIVKEQFQPTKGNPERWIVRNKVMIKLPDATQYVVGINIDVTDQKRIAREVERQHEFLQYIINALPSPFYVKDRQHRWVLANQAMATTFSGIGAEVQFFLGKSDNDIRDAEAAARAWAEDDLCLREPGVHNFEDTFVMEDGSVIHVLKSKVAIRLPDGEQFVVGFNADVTERKLAALDIERSRAFITAIVEAMPYGIWIKDDQRRYVLMNEWESKRIGRNASELVGKTSDHVFDADAANVIAGEDDAVYQSKDTLHFELYLPATRESARANENGRWLRKTKAMRTLPDGSRYLIGAIADITEIKQAELAAQRERQFLEAMIDAIPYTMYVKDHRRRWLLVNHAGTLMSGQSKEFMIGRSDEDVFDPERAARNMREDEQCLASVDPLFFEDAFVDPNGELRAFLKSKRAITLADGSRFLVGLNTDISSLKRTEHELLDSQDRLRLLNTIAAAITAGRPVEAVLCLAVEELAQTFRPFRWDCAEMITENRARVLCCVAGASLPDISGLEYEFDADDWSLERCRSGQTVTIDDVRNLPEESRAQKATRCSGVHASLTMPFLDGNRLIWLMSATAAQPHLWTEHEVAVVRDVVEYLGVAWHKNKVEAERYVVERALISSESRLKTIIESAAEGIVIIDATGIIRMVNPALVKMFGYHEAALLGRDVCTLMPDRHAGGHRNGLARYLATRESRIIGTTTQLLARHHDGIEFPIDLLISETIIDGEHLFTGLVRDITERVRSEEELRVHRDNLTQLVEERTAEMRSARDAAEAANAAKSEFLANMSHELRTPMHAIIAYAKLGLEKLSAGAAPADKLTQYLSRIDQGAARLLVLLNNLLDLSKLESGKMEYHMEDVDVTELVLAALQEFYALAGSRRITLNLESHHPQRANCDKTRIGQVIRNLLSNAIKFTTEGKSVRVRLEPSPSALPPHSRDDPRRDGLCLSVEDEGVGIPEGELESVFDKFVQSSKTNTGAGGTGLGLSISREIVVAHRGRIWAENNSRGGTTFHFIIPRLHREHLAASVTQGGN